MIAENHTNEKTMKIFALLRSGVVLSRNRHFELYRDPAVRRARRLFRLFLSFQKDIEGEQKHVSIFCPLHGNSAQRFGVQLVRSDLKCERTVFLNFYELKLFAEVAPNQSAILLDRLLKTARGWP